MLNSTIQLKIKQRLNKLDSQDYDNLECWHIVEAFNKAQVEWCRRQLHGFNQFKEGDEQSNRRIDDLQILLTSANLILTDKENYSFGTIPTDYFQWKRITVHAKSECCPDKRMVVYLVEEGNLDIILKDANKRPSFEWGETVATMRDGKLFVYTNEEFEVTKGDFIYYRQPRRIEISGCVDPYTGITSTTDVISEFKDDVVEVMIDEAASILAGDMEIFTQYQREQQRVEQNN